MDILIKAVQFILSLSLLIVIHEFGHFFFARLFGVRVEKFFLFFDTKYKLFSKKIGDTEYGIGWIPLGGYVKISGMIDESMDTDQMKKDPEPWELRTKPAWQRFFVMFGGVLFNFIFAFIVYAGMLTHWGEDYIPVDRIEHGLYCSPTALQVGFEHGDKILSLDGEQVEKFSEIQRKLLLDGPSNIRIERAGEERDILLNRDDIHEIRKARNSALFSIMTPHFPVSYVQDTCLGASIGLQEGDVITQVSEYPVDYSFRLREILQKHKGKELVIYWKRGDETMQAPVQIDQTGMLGLMPNAFPEEYVEHKSYTLLSGIPEGVNKCVGAVVDYVKQLKLLFVVEGAANDAGGFIAIANIFPSTWNWQMFWSLTALLSVVLGVMNILPIPALDGGHIMFIVYEIITRRKPPQKFLERAQMAGMLFLLILLVLINGNDIFKLVMRFFN